MDSFETRVRERAYHIWIASGMTDGGADEHWVAAERAIVSEQAALVKTASNNRGAVTTCAQPCEQAAEKKAAPRKAPAKGARAKNARKRASIAKTPERVMTAH